MGSNPRIYPVGLLLESQPCLVVGAGKIAARKAAGLLEVGASVTVIAPKISRDFARLSVTVEQRRYRLGDVAGYRVAVAATGDREVDGAVFSDGEAFGILVNAADDPDVCSFYLPAVLRRGRVTISISTDGGSPALSSWLRDKIGDAVSAHIGEIAEVVATIRAEIRADGHSSEKFNWSKLIDSLTEEVTAGEDRDDLLTRCDAWRQTEWVRLNLGTEC